MNNLKVILIFILVLLNIFIFIYYDKQIDVMNKKHNQQIQQFQQHMNVQKNQLDNKIMNNILVLDNLNNKYLQLIDQLQKYKPVYSDSLSNQFIKDYMYDFIKKYNYYN